MKTHPSVEIFPALFKVQSSKFNVQGFFAILFSSLLSVLAPAHAATMTPISLNGFNRDVMIENTALGPPYNGAALNFNAGEQRAYYQTNLPGTTRGLPLAGAFASASDGTLFQ